MAIVDSELVLGDEALELDPAVRANGSAYSVPTNRGWIPPSVEVDLGNNTGDHHRFIRAGTPVYINIRVDYAWYTGSTALTGQTFKFYVVLRQGNSSFRLSRRQESYVRSLYSFTDSDGSTKRPVATPPSLGEPFARRIGDERVFGAEAAYLLDVSRSQETQYFTRRLGFNPGWYNEPTGASDIVLDGSPGVPVREILSVVPFMAGLRPTMKYTAWVDTGPLVSPDAVRDAPVGGKDVSAWRSGGQDILTRNF